MALLDEKNSLLLLIDIQEKLVASLKKDDIIYKAAKIAEAARVLNIPTIVSEQYPKGLGFTVEIVKNCLQDDTFFVEKTAFSLLQEEGVLEKLKSYNRKQIILCGIEAHICVYQTAVELIEAGFDVTIAKDICASRNTDEFKSGIGLLKEFGAKVSCLEIILFEWLRSSKHPRFKEIQALIK